MSKAKLAINEMTHGAEHKPSWAIGPAEGYTCLGASLPTRDGRRCGNAVVCADNGDGTYKVVTDAGNILKLTAAELEELFHKPEWCQYPRFTSETLRKADEREEAGGVVRLWHQAHNFPTPGMPLLLELEDGSRVRGVRPSYVSSYGVDANYRDEHDNHLANVKRWSHA